MNCIVHTIFLSLVLPTSSVPCLFVGVSSHWVSSEALCESQWFHHLRPTRQRSGPGIWLKYYSLHHSISLLQKLQKKAIRQRPLLCGEWWWWLIPHEETPFHRTWAGNRRQIRLVFLCFIQWSIVRQYFVCFLLCFVCGLGEHPHGGETYFCRTQQVNWEIHHSVGGCETCRCPCFTSFSTSMSVFLTLSALQMFQQSHMPLSLASPLSSSKLHIRHEGKEALLLISDTPLMKWYCGPYKRVTFLQL